MSETKKIGFLFGAGAEVSYGLPVGGKFALDIFRVDATNAKKAFKDMRKSIDKSNNYASNWLPEDYYSKNVGAFGESVYEAIIKNTVSNNRQKIIERINNFDDIAEAIIGYAKQSAFERMVQQDLGKDYSDINVKHQLRYTDLFENGNKVFESKYLAVLLTYYKQYAFQNENEKQELGDIIKAIIQLQLGAMSEELSKKIQESVFEKDELELDIFDDLGGNLSVNYHVAGVEGLKLLSKKKNNNATGILNYAYQIIEQIYAEVLDYKSLIDSHWHYLYNPKNEWMKFCKISIFLITVQEYIKNAVEEDCQKEEGYYDDLNNSEITVSTIATSNYNNSLITQKIYKKRNEVIFLNGSVDEYYDPYLNKIGTKEELEKENKHFIVPLIFTQSGTKPMTSIDMSIKYVDFYNKLKSSTAICSIGFGFNSDDEHINGIIRTLIERDKKTLYVIERIDGEFQENKQRKLAKKLKVKEKQRIKFILVDSETRHTTDRQKWTEKILQAIEEDKL